jgi:hypothetical protein
MKKTYQLIVDNKHKDRVIDGIKHDVRKYIKREKNKKLPEDKDQWRFNCKLSKDEEIPAVVDFVDLIKSIDELANAEAKTLYVEIFAYSIKREPKEVKAVDDDQEIKEKS